jgi:hypothetical protein
MCITFCILNQSVITDNDLLIMFRLYVVWMLLIFRVLWPWDVTTYRGAAASTGPVSYPYGS